MKIPERDVLPTLLLPEDPSAQDESLLPPLTQKEARLFHQRLAPCLSGKQPWDASLAEAAEQLRLNQPFGKLPPAPDLEIPLSDEILSDLCEDYNPDAGVMGERITGDAYAPFDSRVGAALLFVPTLWRGQRGVDCWAQEAGDPVLKRAVQALDRSPPWLFAGHRPLAWGEPATAGLWVGRLTRVGAEFCPITAWELPATLPLKKWYRRIQGELWSFRLWHPGASLAEMLRLRPELVYRAALELARRHS
ncbi:MAG TPA: hypothetical protein PLA94_13750 [Myxococcota bacterium]|nr:hypothetical protein [Myxococcota bacterium]HND31064.1 hypothetical protein [Myxococcota bacterium]